jgi:protein-L-isoaspartate(D-aspartate) O-methyltransferase
LEIVPELAERAAAKLEKAGIKGVDVRQADGLRCGDFAERFDIVVVTASAPAMPPSLMELVKTGGLIFAVCGHAPAMEAVCMRQTAPRRWDTESLFETDLPRLIGAEDQPTFEF